MTTWNDETWDSFCALLEEAWPGTFDDDAGDAWRLLLNDADPRQVVNAMRRLLAKGAKFRPSVAELMAEMRADPSLPTFDEMFVIVFGPAGVLSARPQSREWKNEGERKASYTEAVVEACKHHHLLVGAFVIRQGITRLKELPIFDPEYAGLRRKELQQAWEAHLEAHEGREVHALVAGTGNQGLRQLDPLSALGLDPAPTPQIAAGAAEGDRQ
jgi:hypothetical protein